MVAMLVTFVIVLFCWWINFERSAIENAAMHSFDKTCKSLEENGYMVTYDNASFNMLFPMNIMTIKNFKITIFKIRSNINNWVTKILI